jgi:hypothetical protein
VATGDRADDVTRQPGADPATGLVGQGDSCNRCGHCDSFGFKELPAREVSGDEKRHYWTDGRRAVLAALSRISTAYRRTRTDDAAGGGELPVRAAAGAGTAAFFRQLCLIEWCDGEDEDSETAVAAGTAARRVG